jgi:uncharacterized membrane protein YebE (DUF533 family)
VGNALEELMRTGMASLGGGAQGGATQGAAPGGGIGDLLGQVLGAAQGGGAQGAAPGAAQGGGVGDLLGQVLGAVQGGLSSAAQNPGQAGGIGAILGGLLGGGGDSIKGALGGGALAMLASIAFKAMQGAGQGGAGAATPGFNLPGLTAPETPEQHQAMESTAQIVLKGMINAAKADGQIDPNEMQRIVGKLQEAGMDEQTKAWVMTEMSQPLNLDAFAAEIPSQEVAAQVYAASLLAIEVDTDGERRYMAQLAQKTGLHPMVAQHIQQSMGMAA